MSATQSIPTPWLKSPRFDLSLIVGVAALGLASGAVVVANPDWFWVMLTADLWLLGYHHLIATFTRLTFDKQSFAEHRFLILGLPWLVALSVTGLCLSFGVWLLPTIYLYWQWFHYTRQSEGISKAFRGKARERFVGDQNLTRVVFWLVPLAGLLKVSSRDPEQFLNLPIKTLPVPPMLADLAVAIALAAVLVWLFQHLRAWTRGELALPYVLYMASHFTLFFVGYVVIESLNFGWLAINVWHNAQYVLFVWLYNNRRFRGEVSAEHPFLSTISQNNRFVLYIAVCLSISTAFYFFVGHSLISFLRSSTGLGAIAVALIVYQTLNFHHYIVDSVIWKLRKKPIRNNLGITD
ncbi:MAG: hypothetical protein AB8G17_18895 [Gammaproteobacteria bacterium]